MRSLALPLAALVCVALLVAGGMLLMQEPERPTQVAQPGAQVERPAPLPELAPSELRSVSGAARPAPGAPVPTTVAWPVEVELELVEPSLFFRHGPAAPGRLAAAICQRIS